MLSALQGTQSRYARLLLEKLTHAVSVFFSSHLSSTSFHLASIPPFTNTVLVRVTEDRSFPKPDSCFLSLPRLSLQRRSTRRTTLLDGFDDITFSLCSYFLSSCSFSVFFFFFFLLALPALFQLLLWEYHWSWIGFLLFCPHSLRLEIPSLANANLGLQPRNSLNFRLQTVCVQNELWYSLLPFKAIPPHSSSVFPQ